MKDYSIVRIGHEYVVQAGTARLFGPRTEVLAKLGHPAPSIAGQRGAARAPGGRS